jgi:Protein of unknown function (DUF2992)
MKLTVYFEQPYWAGIVEETDGCRLKAAKHIFGSEPLDGHILEFFQKDLLPLWEKVSQSVNAKQSVERRINPKRMARIVAKEKKNAGFARNPGKHSNWNSKTENVSVSRCPKPSGSNCRQENGNFIGKRRNKNIEAGNCRRFPVSI